MRIADRVRGALSRDSFARSVGVGVAGAAGAQALSVMFVPVITRLYDPHAFGVLSVFVAIISAAIPLLSLRYDLAIAVTHAPRERQALVCLSLLAVLSISAAAAVIVAVGAAVAPSLHGGLQAFARYLWIVPIGFLLGGANQVLTAWAVAQGRLTSVAQTRVVQSLGQVVIQMACGVVLGGPSGLMFGDAGGRGCAALVLLTGWWRGRRDVAPPVGRRDVVSAARRFRRFPLISGWSSLLNNAGVYVPTVLITVLYGTHVGGLFGLGQRVFALPMGLVGTAVGQAYLAHSATGRATGDGAQLALYRSTRRRLAVLGLLATFGVLAAGGSAFAAVFGESWREAGVYCQLLAPMLLAQFVASPLAVTLDLVERQDLHAWWDAGRLIVVAAAFGVARALGFSPRGALLLYSLASAATYAVLLGVIQHGLRGATGARPARAVS